MSGGEDRSSMATAAEITATLREAVENVVAVDAHAHNLVAVDSSFPFLRCFSEAEGEALDQSQHSLSFKRSIRDIAALYNCVATLNGVETHRSSGGLLSFGSKCFEAAKFSAILIDDGIVFDKMHHWTWHKCLAPAVGRIVRIEHIAEGILNEELTNGSDCSLGSFTEKFLARMKSIAEETVALKSIAAYRSGLDIDTNVSKISAEEGLRDDLLDGVPVRIKNKSFIDYLFTLSLEYAVSMDLPMQIHTGFGDKDLDLRLSNPLHLRSVLDDKRFSNCRIILLHASYPFAKEASYLSSIYSQVYLDFGLAVPKLSVQGMISSVKELLHLAPTKKVMFSSDGYAFPETFYLASKRAREVILSVLSDACKDGDLTIPEAIEAIKDIFMQNALQLYKLDRKVSADVNGSNIFYSTISKPLINTQEEYTVFVRVIWVDASGQQRCRVIPVKRFHDFVKNNGIGLTFASMGMPSFTDGPAEGSGLTGVGEIRLIPDMSTLHRIPWRKEEEMVLADMQVRPGEAWEYCPRDALRRASRILKDEFNLVMNAGFESEFYLLKNVIRDGNDNWVPFDSTPYCSTSGFDAASPVLQEVNSALQSMNISVEQLHAEAGKGQFELSFAHTVCSTAADNLVFVREVIRAVARKNGLLATFVPKCYLDDIGSGSHVHLSLWENSKNVFMASEVSKTPHGMSIIGEHFMAGVFYHLPSILSFTAPLPNSYDRIQPDTWSGAYHCWGLENKEAPLRTACPPGISSELVSNFELKAFDGCANPYLGLASILAAGIDGLRRGLSLPEPIDANPSTLDLKVKRLPKNLAESVEALRGDVVFIKDIIGEKLLKAIIAVREAEVDYYAKNKEAYKELKFRY